MANLRTANKRKRRKLVKAQIYSWDTFRYRKDGTFAVYPVYRNGTKRYYGSPFIEDEYGDLDRAAETIDRVLTEQFGPDHQEVLSRGQMVSEFRW